MLAVFSRSKIFVDEDPDRAELGELLQSDDHDLRNAILAGANKLERPAHPEIRRLALVQALHRDQKHCSAIRHDPLLFTGQKKKLRLP